MSHSYKLINACVNASPESKSTLGKYFSPFSSQHSLPMSGFNISPDTFFAQPSSVLIVLRPLSGVNCYEPACGNYKTESGLPSRQSRCLAARCSLNSCAQSPSRRLFQGARGGVILPILGPPIWRMSHCAGSESLIEMYADKIPRLHLQIACIYLCPRSLCPLVFCLLTNCVGRCRVEQQTF